MFARYRKTVGNQDLQFDMHQNAGNTNATKLSHAIMCDWLLQEAEVYAEVVLVSFRHQKKENGKTTLYYMKERYQLLQAFYTWELLRQKFVAHVKRENILVEGKPAPIPSLSTFRTVTQKSGRPSASGRRQTTSATSASFPRTSSAAPKHDGDRADCRSRQEGDGIAVRFCVYCMGR